MESSQNKTPIISVTLLTYNHKDYIRESLDGIVKQVTDFPFEVIVGDDCSTDGTQDILREYGAKFPSIFRLVLREKNIGVTHNLYDLLKRTRGKYIAGLEGDDYWTDPKKLQMQKDFLDQHPEYIGCSHEVEMIDENGNKLYQNGKYIEGRHWTFYRSVYTYEEDYQNFRLPGQGSTYLYRNIFLHPAHDYSIMETASPMVGDMTLLLLLSSCGDWYFMRGKVMARYRFVTTKGKENWASWVVTKNRTYIDFCYRENLENYAHNVLKKSLDLKDKKFELFNCAYWLHKNSPDEENDMIFRDICKKVTPAYYYWGRWLIQRVLDGKILPTVQYAKRQGELATKNVRLQGQTWSQFEQAAKGKTIVAFGAGVSFDEFMRKYKKKYEIACILDNNANRWGATLFYYDSVKDYYAGNYEFVSIVSPNTVKNWDASKFVILITSTLYYESIAQQLDEIHFHDYWVFGIMEAKTIWYRFYDFYEQEILHKKYVMCEE